MKVLNLFAEVVKAAAVTVFIFLRFCYCFRLQQINLIFNNTYHVRVPSGVGEGSQKVREF